MRPAEKMKTRINFGFRIDIWTADGESIVEHVDRRREPGHARHLLSGPRKPIRLGYLAGAVPLPKIPMRRFPRTPPFLLFGRGSRLMRPAVFIIPCRCVA